MKVMGSEGYIEIKDFWMGKSAMFFEKGPDGFFRSRPTEVYEPEYRSTGYQYEAAEVAECVRAGKKESPVMPLSETRAIMALMDRLRSSWGMIYPQELFV
jgi:predicted dehydrogenase